MVFVSVFVLAATGAKRLQPPQLSELTPLLAMEVSQQQLQQQPQQQTTQKQPPQWLCPLQVTSLLRFSLIQSQTPEQRTKTVPTSISNAPITDESGSAVTDSNGETQTETVVVRVPSTSLSAEPQSQSSSVDSSVGAPGEMITAGGNRLAATFATAAACGLAAQI